MRLFTITTSVTAELEERGSRFIGSLVPWADFENKLAISREVHRKASHHVTAFRRMLPNNRIEESARDDGEPAGTSGMPTLKVLCGANLVDAGIIIARYFGGTKLGAGGLARAYSGTALRAVEAANMVPWFRVARRSISCSFENMSSLEQRIHAEALTVVSREFTETGVIIAVEGPEDAIASITATIDQSYPPLR